MNRDKLEQYIKREIDGISYDGENEMWESFQNENGKELSNWGSSKFFYNILIGGIVIAASTVYFLNNTSIENTIIEPIEISQKGISNLKKVSKNDSAEKQIQSISSDKIASKAEKIARPSSTSMNVRLKETSKNSLKEGGTLEFSLNSNYSNSVKSVDKKQVEFGTNFSNETSFSKLNSQGFLKEEKNNSLFLKKESTNERGTIQELPQLEKQFSTIETDDEKLILPANSIMSYSGFSERYARGGFMSSNNKIYTSSIEFGFIKMTDKRSGFKINFGGSAIDGYSFSQDSIIIQNGLSIVSNRKNKDLNYIIEAHLSAEYFVRRNKFSFGFGVKNSYAFYNKFTIIEQGEITRFTGWSQSGSKATIYNQWSGMNRFGITPFTNISFRHHNYEVGLVVSKRLNKLINGDLAAKQKSNTPYQAGIILSKYF